MCKLFRDVRSKNEYKMKYSKIDKLLDKLLDIKKERTLSKLELSKFNTLQAKWIDIMNKQELNPYKVSVSKRYGKNN